MMTRAAAASCRVGHRSQALASVHCICPPLHVASLNGTCGHMRRQPVSRMHREQVKIGYRPFVCHLAFLYFPPSGCRAPCMLCISMSTCLKPGCTASGVCPRTPAPATAGSWNSRCGLAMLPLLHLCWIAACKFCWVLLTTTSHHMRAIEGCLWQWCPSIKGFSHFHRKPCRSSINLLPDTSLHDFVDG